MADEPEKESARRTLYANIEKATTAMSTTPLVPHVRAAALRDLALAYRYVAGGPQPGGPQPSGT